MRSVSRTRSARHQASQRTKPPISSIYSARLRIITRSASEAKALGIAMGEPWHVVRERVGMRTLRMRFE